MASFMFESAFLMSGISMFEKLLWFEVDHIPCGSF